ncbi:MAG TPA: hypothetical protein VFH08_20255 [Chitinophagaceae bacterium]|nr:hypothetical protein [Chitinophagaceae bacterium]
MKTITPKLITLSIFTFIFLTACKKETDDVIDRQTALLIEKSWKFEMYGLDENNNGVIEESENNMLACELDDIFTFHANGTGVFAGGTTPCSVGEPAVINFNWSFSNNGTELAIFAAPEKINKLDETILEVYYMDQNSQGQPVKFIRRFSH